MSSIVERDGAYVFAYGDGMPVGHEVLYAGGVSAETEALSRFRSALGTLNGSAVYETVASRKAINEGYGRAGVSTESGLEWTGTNLTESLVEASDQEVRDFLDWNAEEYRKLQTALHEATPELKESVYQTAGRLAAVGYLTPIQQVRYGTIITNVGGLHALDTFEAKGYGVLGLCSGHAEDVKIRLANMFEDQRAYTGITPELESTVFHEVTHAYGAVYRGGYAWSKKSSLLVEEVATSHITRVATEKKQFPGVLNPSDRAGQFEAYDDESVLIDLLGAEGGTDFTAMDLVGGFFGNHERRAELHAKLDASVQTLLPDFMGGWRGLSNGYNVIPSRRRQKYIHNITDRIFEKIGVEVLDKVSESSNLTVISYGSEIFPIGATEK